MGIYGSDRYGAPTTYGGATFAASGFDLSPINIMEVGYGDVVLQWRAPDSTAVYSRIRIVRSQTGFPANENDGLNIREVLPTSPSATHADNDLTQGTHYYYAWWIETDQATYSSTIPYTRGQVAKSVGGQGYVSLVDNNIGNAQTNTTYWAPINTTKKWVLAGQAVILTTHRYDHTTRLYQGLPSYYLGADNVDWTEPAEVDKSTLTLSAYPALAKFLSIFGWAFDGIQTKYDTLLRNQDPDLVAQWYLEALSNQVGIPLEGSATSRLQRVRIANAPQLARQRGTLVGLQNDITATLGWDAVATIGVNKVLTWDQADAHSPEIDYWDAAGAYVVNDYVRFGGSGTIYRAILANRGASQGPPNGGANTWWTQASWNALPATTMYIPRYGSCAGWIPGDRGVSSVGVLTGASSPIDSSQGNCFVVTNITGSTQSIWTWVAERFNTPAWSVGTQYRRGELVLQNSMTWEAVVDNLGVTPGTDPLTWRLFLDRVPSAPDPQAVMENAIPVTPSVSWTFSFFVATVTSLAGASVRADISWYTKDGVFISTSNGSTSGITGGWTRRTCTATAPSNARYAIMVIAATSVTAGGQFIYRSVQMEQAAAASTYVPPRRVEVLVKPDRVNLAWNPSMESTSGTLVVRENLMVNPTSFTAATNWSANAGTGGTAANARQTGQSGWFNSVTTSSRVTWSVATSAVSGGINFAAGGGGGVVPTKTYSAIAQVRANKVQRVVMSIDWYNSGAAFISTTAGTPVVLAANTVTTLNITGAVAPAGAASAIVTILAVAGTSGTNWAVSDWIEATNAMFEENDMTLTYGGGTYGPSQTFFKGDYAPGDYGHPAEYTYQWAGTANNSVSQMRAPALDSYNVGASTDVPSTRSTEIAGLFGTYVQRIRWATASAGSIGDAQTVVGLTVGADYVYSRYVYVPVGSPDVVLSIDSIGTNTSLTTKGQWVRISLPFIATATSHVIRILPSTASVKGDDRVYSDGAMVERGATLLPYFDGSFGLSTEYFWAGVANNSKSLYYQGYLQKRYRLDDIIRRSVPYGTPFTTRYSDV